MPDEGTVTQLPVDNSGEGGRLHKLVQRFASLRAQAEEQPGIRRGGSVQVAWDKPDDPMFYWKQKNIPFDIWSENSTALQKAQEYSRILYITHPVIGPALDVYSKYPLSGMEIICPKDKKLADFYSSVFMDGLNYEHFLPTVGRERWMTGEGFPLGNFNELLGVWDDDELILPTDVKVEPSMFSRDPVLKMRLPERLMQVLRQPHENREEYIRIVESYPELLEYVGYSEERQFFTVSNDLLSHIKREADAFHPRGIPILMRAFRAVVQEEMLNAAQDGIASRLYTPLVLVKVGASAQDLGIPEPWIPTQGDLDLVTSQFNEALAADFRMAVTHFAVQVDNVFGRESIPDMSRDFDRLEEKMLQAFGMSKTMLSGASQGDTYAADALHRDTMTQVLIEYQREMRRFFRRRCEVVAEAQGHYDYELKGGRPVPLMEEYIDVDPDTGDRRIRTRPKLLLPDLRIKSMNLKDEDRFHEMLEAMRAAGIPISMRTRLQNIQGVDLDNEVAATTDEQVDMAVQAAKVRQKTYQRLQAEGLPIPPDLIEEFQPRTTSLQSEQQPLPGMQQATVAGDPLAQAEAQDATMLGTDSPINDALVPTIVPGVDGEGDVVAVKDRTEIAAGPGGRLPRNRARPLVEKARPSESDEQRKGMPRASHLAALSADDIHEAVRNYDYEAMSGGGASIGAFMDGPVMQERSAALAEATRERLAAERTDQQPEDEHEPQEPAEGLETGTEVDVELSAPLGTSRLAHRGLRHTSIFYKDFEDDGTSASLSDTP